MGDFYESGRLYPFRDAEKGYHSNQDLMHAYYAWANALPGKREPEWQTYCDIRDGFAIGTNKRVRQKDDEQQRGYLEARQWRRVASDTSLK